MDSFIQQLLSKTFFIKWISFCCFYVLQKSLFFIIFGRFFDGFFMQFKLCTKCGQKQSTDKQRTQHVSKKKKFTQKTTFIRNGQNVMAKNNNKNKKLKRKNWWPGKNNVLKWEIKTKINQKKHLNAQQQVKATSEISHKSGHKSLIFRP